MNRALNDALDDAQFEARMRANVVRMRWLAAEMLDEARRTHPDIDDHGLDAQLAAFRDDGPPMPCLDDAWYARMATTFRHHPTCRGARPVSHSILMLQLVIILAAARACGLVAEVLRPAAR